LINYGRCYEYTQTDGGKTGKDNPRTNSSQITALKRTCAVLWILTYDFLRCRASGGIEGILFGDGFHFVIFVQSILVMDGQKLSSLQLELLNVYSFQPDEKDLLAIRKLLAEYFSDKLVNKVDQAVAERKITEADLGSWLNE
jgi:hypothetical protein